MKYMLLIYGDPSLMHEPGSPERQAESSAWMDVTERMTAAGVRIAGDPLQGVESATTVRGTDGVVSDGPFAETKEILAGYYLIDVPDLDEALRWARQLPALAYGSVEVRPLAQMSVA
jgi:hypothetical protein